MPYRNTISWNNATTSWVPIQTWSVSSNSNDWQIHFQANHDIYKEIEIKEEDLVDILGGEENDK